MPDLANQILALIFLMCGVAFGYQRWLKPRLSTLDKQGRGLVMLIIVTLAGGFIGSPFWWFDFPQSFSWDLPPLASRMLAVAGWSFAVMCFLVLEKLSARRVQLALLTLETYLPPLVMAILIFHLDRFDFTAPLTYGFFLIAAGMTAIGFYFLCWQPVITPTDLGEPTTPLIKSWFGLSAILMGAWGIALFSTDNGPSSLIWVWTGDLLTSRLIASMLLTMAIGSAYATRHGDAVTPMLGMSLTYGFGVALANLWSVLADKPIQFSYLIIFGIVGFGSTVLLLSSKRTES